MRLIVKMDSISGADMTKEQEDALLDDPMPGLGYSCRGCNGKGVLEGSLYGLPDEPCVMCNPAHPGHEGCIARTPIKDDKLAGMIRDAL